MRVFMRCLAVVLGVLVLYLAAWPTRVNPVAWQPPQSRGLTGVFASNGKLARHERIATQLPGPEAVAVDFQGSLYTGTLDGRVMVIEPSAGTRTLATTGGRPLGLKVLADGSLVVADAQRGLLRIDRSGRQQTLADRDEKGQRFGFVDDVALLPNGHVLFTDASARFGLPVFELDALEHGNTGGLYELDPVTRKVQTVARGFSFANGVAAHHEGHYAFVNETWSYRVHRV